MFTAQETKISHLLVLLGPSSWVRWIEVSVTRIPKSLYIIVVT